MKFEKVVAYSGNRKVYPAIAASLNSLTTYNWIDKAYLVIEDDEFPFELPKCAEIINASNQEYFPSYGPNYNCAWSVFTLIRTAYPLMFPQHAKILSLDCDTIVKTNIADLWMQDIEDYYFYASMEPSKSGPISPDIYANVGVCVMNLKKLRGDGKAQEIVDRINSVYYGWPDQDAMNEVCRGHILDMDPTYNSTPWTKIVEDCKIHHYAATPFESYINEELVRRYIPRRTNDVDNR